MTHDEARIAELTSRVADGMPRTIDELCSLVRIPGCAFPGFPREEVDRAAAAVAQILREAGCETVELLDVGPGIPQAVYAEVPGPSGAPTVLLYAHYDIQPAGNLADWSSPPFEPEVRSGRLYGRGAADDKSGVVLHAALVRAFDGQPPCTVRIIIEGDEECGGSFEHFPPAHPALFDADAIIIADTGNMQVGLPTFTSALRGMAMVDVTVETLAAPVHSGMFGGPAPDALMALIALLATLRDDQGDTAIDGVPGYQWQGADYDEQTYREQAGILVDQPLIGTGSLASRLFTKPAVSVVGIDAPQVQGAINAVVPKASARVSLRVPPTTDPKAAQKALMDHLVRNAPWGVTVTVQPDNTGEGFAADTTEPAYVLMAEAMRLAYGADPIEVGSGGSIPLVAVLKEVVPDSSVLLVGAEDMDANIHAPDESVDLGELEHAALAQVLFVQLLAERASGASS